MRVCTCACVCVQDKDGDGKVSLQDFLLTIRTETLLIEAFGPCLPCTEDTEEFSSIMFSTEEC